MGSSLGLDDAFGHWLAGFVDGEGCFTIAPQPSSHNRRDAFYCRFHIRLRADDRPILEEIIVRVGGIGNFYEYGPSERDLENLPGSKPQVLWVVSDQAGCAALVRIFDAYPLRAKKARDYALWREAVSARSRRDWTRMRLLRESLGDSRAFPDGMGSPIAIADLPVPAQMELEEVA